MSRFRFSAAVALVLLSLSALAEDPKKTIGANYRKIEKAFAAKSVSGIMAFMAKNLVSIGPNRPSQDRAKFEAELTRTFDALNSIALKVVVKSIALSPNTAKVAMESNIHMESKNGPGGKPAQIESRGKSTHTWTLSKGAWLISRIEQTGKPVITVNGKPQSGG